MFFKHYFFMVYYLIERLHKVCVPTHDMTDNVLNRPFNNDWFAKNLIGVSG